MSTKIRSITVALEEDINSEDIEVVLSAIRCMRGVLDVTANSVTPNDWVSVQRVQNEVRAKLYEFARSL